MSQEALVARLQEQLDRTRDLLEERTRERDEARRERDINADHCRRRDDGLGSAVFK